MVTFGCAGRRTTTTIPSPISLLSCFRTVHRHFGAFAVPSDFLSILITGGDSWTCTWGPLGTPPMTEYPQSVRREPPPIVLDDVPAGGVRQQTRRSDRLVDLFLGAAATQTSGDSTVAQFYCSFNADTASHIHGGGFTLSVDLAYKTYPFIHRYAVQTATKNAATRWGQRTEDDEDVAQPSNSTTTTSLKTTHEMWGYLTRWPPPLLPYH